MLKTVVLVVAGLAAGFAVAYWAKESKPLAGTPESAIACFVGPMVFCSRSSW